MSRISLLLATIMLSSWSFAQNLHFASKPSLSPSGDVIYFSHGGDIYKVPTTGGLALRVISMGGNEANPKVSPDGKYLAFSSNIQGNNNVYVVPVAGGDVVQLTFHDASDVPASWSRCSKYLYFESNRFNTMSTYKVALAGGTPVRLFPHYFNTVANLVQNPVTQEFYFNESTESYRFATRKGYRGDHNPNIKSWDPLKKEYKELTSFRGRDIWPMTDKNGELYYVSEEKNGEANIVRYSDGKYLTQFEESVQYPSISFDGSKIVFVKGYKIFVLDTKSGEYTMPKIEMAFGPEQWTTSVPLSRPGALAVSPDGKKLAFSFRGLLFVADAKGNFIKIIDTPHTERVDEVIWSSDNKTIIYTRTHKGYTGIFSQRADLPTQERPFYTPQSMVKSLSASPKIDRVAFIDGGKKVMLLDPAQGTVKEIATHEFWSFQNYGISFSSNGAYLAYTAVNLFERDVFLYELSTGKRINLTNSANFENDPQFSPDGKYLYLLANRTTASFPRGASAQLYRVALHRVMPLFESDEYNKLFTPEKTSADSTVLVEVANIQRRYEPVVRRGEQNMPYIFSAAGKSFLFYNSNHEGDWALYVQEIKDWEMKPAVKMKGMGSAFTFARGGKELFAMDRDGVYKVDAASANAVKVELKYNFQKSIKDEFEQMFYEVWSTLEQNFYDHNFHGKDWKAKREYYSQFLPFVRSRDDLRVLINDMLNELNSSHMGFSTFGREEESSVRYVTFAPGLIFEEDNPYKLNRVVDGSKASFVNNPLKPGDVLVSVNRKRIDKEKNREIYFSSAVAPKEMELGFSREGKEFTVRLPFGSTSDLRSLLYTEWEDANRNFTERESGGKIAYLHMRDMSSESLDKFLIDMNTYGVHKEALILDLRFNNGGNVHKEVIDYLNQKSHFTWSHRDNPQVSHPNVTPLDKPIIVLVNERSLSDAEVTSNGIKALSIAKIVGTETYRWIIFTSGARLVDGSTVRLPAWGCYTLDGKNLEFEGVAPDIYVKNTLLDRVNNRDPQLERAIKELLPALKR